MGETLQQSTVRFLHTYKDFEVVFVSEHLPSNPQTSIFTVGNPKPRRQALHCYHA